ncbi:response regulator [Limisalsivibrio acetivorans]|uniref:response regulator n=1 Tax=Limisalsivibrio acetivorans TaxID=1304888 RepID=UPI0003B2F321|nr:response regulator [Limisalsivibrio acetivorans]
MSNYRILIVEDETGVAEALKTRLIRKHESVCVAYDGEEGINAAEEFRPDLVITDLKMPVCDGIEMMKHIKNKYPDIDLIVVTASIEEEDRIKSEEIGVEGYFVKPLIVKDLLDKVNELCMGRGGEC